jgi:hypothetical protein
MTGEQREQCRAGVVSELSLGRLSFLTGNSIELRESNTFLRVVLVG